MFLVLYLAQKCKTLKHHRLGLISSVVNECGHQVVSVSWGCHTPDYRGSKMVLNKYEDFSLRLNRVLALIFFVFFFKFKLVPSHGGTMKKLWMPHRRGMVLHYQKRGVCVCV